MPKFKSVDELAIHLKNKLNSPMLIAEEKLNYIFEEAIRNFYFEYTPTVYDRIFQFMQSVTRTSVQTTTNGFIFKVFIDTSAMNYTSGSQPSGEQVMGAAAYGRHGAMGLAVADFKGEPVWENIVTKFYSEVIPYLENELRKAGFIIS